MRCAPTPRPQKGLRAASESFRANPAFDTQEAIQALGVGEALVSVLDERGAPTVVQKTLIRPPASRLGPITEPERQAVMARSPVRGLYDAALDRESAFETLRDRTLRQAAPPPTQPAPAPTPRAEPRPRASNRQTMVEAAAKSLVRSVASQLGRELMRGMLGGIRRR